ncbi:MAG TPA: YihY/virulence factor BrkB family protein [Acidimicrobiales bacterium]
MSSASLVPETRELSGDDAWRTLHRTGEGRLMRDAFRRMRVADGFSHARSLAFVLSLVAIQGLIGLVGIANIVHKGSISQIVIATIQRVVPGPAGHLLTTAGAQAHNVAGDHRYTAVYFAVVGGLITATTAMGQVERGLNRIYGIEQDRPSMKKYSLAFVFAVSAGTLVTLAFTCLAVGKGLFRGTGLNALSDAWSVIRWPLGFALILLAVTCLFRWSPRRSQPNMSWLAFGAGVSMVLWGIVTIGFGLFFQNSSTFGNTYGPLAGVVALLLWSFFSSVALFYGAAIAAQLEAIRANVPAPQDPEKVANSSPTARSSTGGSAP